MRLFLALSIPSGVRERLSSLIRDLRRADAQPRWVSPENLHVTLKFIGQVSSDSSAAIEDALATLRPAQRVSLEFRDVGFFPNERRPSVVWVGIEASQNLAPLAGDLNRVLERLGIPREEKPFVPHLTIARFKEARLSAALRAEIEKWRGCSFGILATGEFHLMESKLKSTGAEYTTLRSFRFAQDDAEGKAQ